MHLFSGNTKTSEHTKRKIFLFAFFLLFVGISLIFADVASAQSANVNANNNGGVLSGVLSLAGDILSMPLNWLLYAVLNVVGWLTSLAVSILEIAVNPASVDAMFKMNSIYKLWQMIRDFFNLFFILTLLFIAFATIFQISSFNYKSTLGKLLLMALLVNFSYPISRFVIDTANVPMYFFMNAMLEDKTNGSIKDAAETALSASRIKDILIPKKMGLGADWRLTGSLITAIIFMFLFGVSLVVLSVMLLIRNIMLVVLIIFSSVGFAGLVIPGFRQYATKWWDNLLKYAFFGPAAMLMLLISVTFLKEFKVGGNGTVVDQIQKGASNLATNAGDSSVLAAATMTIIPIIFIWLSISIGQTMGIAGAGAVTSRAQQFSKWAGRKSSGYDWSKRRFDAFVSERKKRADAKFAATNFGSRWGLKLNQKQDELSAKRVGTRLESRGARHDASAAEDSQKREIAAEAANHRINERTSASELKRQAEEAAKTGNVAWLAAVTNQQGKRKETADDIDWQHKKLIDDRYKNIGEVENAARKENDSALETHRADLVYKTETERERALKDGKIKLDQQSSRSLDRIAMAAVKTGKINQEMLETMRKEDPDKAAAFTKAIGDGLQAMEMEYARITSSGGTLTEEQQKARSASHQAYFSATGKMHGTVMGSSPDHVAVRERVFKKSNAGTLKANLKDSANRGAYVDDIIRSTPTGQVVNTVATLLEEDSAAASVFVQEIRRRSGDPNADAILQALIHDRRTSHL